jgi:hypothetical protein
VIRSGSGPEASPALPRACCCLNELAPLHAPHTCEPLSRRIWTTTTLPSKRNKPTRRRRPLRISTRARKSRRRAHSYELRRLWRWARICTGSGFLRPTNY